MNKELYEAIKPVRGREPSELGESRLERFGENHPKSLVTMVILGYFIMLGGVGAWCYAIS